MRFRAPGANRRPSRRELNELSAMLGKQSAVGGVFDPSTPQNSRLVAIRNDTGAAVRRFETLSLGDLLWTLEDDGTSDVIFEGLKADPTKPTIVMSEDVDVGQIGYGLIEGLAVAWVAAGSGSRCTPATTSNIMLPDESGRYAMIGTPSATDPKLVAVILENDASNAHYLTPAGGIPARTGTASPWTPGVATCTRCEQYLDGGVLRIRTTTVTTQVYNDTPAVGGVGGNKLIQTKMIGGRRFVDEEPC